jgi:outer membrane protein
MRYSKAISLVAVGALAVLLQPAAQGQTAKIGAIDTQMVLFGSLAGQAVEAQLEAYSLERRQTLVDLQADYTQKQQTLQNQQLSLSAEAIRERQAELQRLATSIERAGQDYEADMLARQELLLAPVIDMANDVLTQYAEEQGYTLIFDIASSALAYMAPEADVSADVKGRMDARTTASGGAPPAAPPAAPPVTAPELPAATDPPTTP